MITDKIRLERPEDYAAVERLTLAAFETFTFADGSAIEPFMALELKPGYLGANGGKWYEDDVFEIDRNAFEAWSARNQAEG
jgi:predicted N-acetyltransferase YhbS